MHKLLSHGFFSGKQLQYHNSSSTTTATAAASKKQNRSYQRLSNPVQEAAEAVDMDKDVDAVYRRPSRPAEGAHTCKYCQEITLQGLEVSGGGGGVGKAHTPGSQVLYSETKHYRKAESKDSETQEEGHDNKNEESGKEAEIAKDSSRGGRKTNLEEKRKEKILRAELAFKGKQALHAARKDCVFFAWALDYYSPSTTSTTTSSSSKSSSKSINKGKTKAEALAAAARDPLKVRVWYEREGGGEGNGDGEGRKARNWRRGSDEEDNVDGDGDEEAKACYTVESDGRGFWAGCDPVILYAGEDPSSSASPGPLPRPPRQTYSTSADFAVVRGWIRRCESGHRHEHGYVGCEKTVTKSEARALKPSHVISISDDKSGIRLISGEDMGLGEGYVALSQCWQKRQPYHRTMTSNLAERYTRIRVEETCHIVRDAIYTARQLGFRYLWAGSLCLVHDADDDNTAQTLTPEVYANAALVLVAAAARDGSEGFLNLPATRRANANFKINTNANANQRPSYPAIQLKYACPDKRIGSVLLDTRNKRPECLIETQASALQEQLLAKRVLYFGSYQVWFRCQQGRRLYDGGSALGERVYGYRAAEEFILRNSAGAGAADEAEGRAAWYALVAEYSRRSQRGPDERLPALGGLAQRFDELLSDTYLAGHWRQDIERSLAWMRAPGQRGDGRKARNDNVLCNRACRGPSWSWAALDSGIVFNWPRTSASSAGSECLDAAVELVDEGAAFGAVRAGRLVLRGRVKGARLVKSYPSSFDSHAYEVELPGVDIPVLDGRYMVSVVLDHIPPLTFEESGEAEPMELPCYVWVMELVQEGVFLILTSENGVAFRRIGVLVFQSLFERRRESERERERSERHEMEIRNWIRECEPRVMTLI